MALTHYCWVFFIGLSQKLLDHNQFGVAAGKSDADFPFTPRPGLTTAHHGLLSGCCKSFLAGIQPPVAWKSLGEALRLDLPHAYHWSKVTSERGAALIAVSESNSFVLYLGRERSVCRGGRLEYHSHICFPHDSAIPCSLAVASCLCTPPKKKEKVIGVGFLKVFCESLPPPPPTKCGTAQCCMCLIAQRAVS